MIDQDSRFYLPNLYTFQNGNTFYGSFCGLRFRVTPQTEKGEDDIITGTLTPLVWYGPCCLEESEPVAEATFPLTTEGYQAVIAWLDGQYQLMQAAAPKPES